MSCFGNVGIPDEAYVSVRSKLIEDDGEIDRPTRNRRKTDQPFIFVMAFFFFILACMLIYCATQGSNSNQNNNINNAFRRNRRDFSEPPGWHDQNIMNKRIKEISFMIGIIIALIMITILVMRYFIGYFIWALLGLAIIISIIITVATWAVFISAKDSTHGVIALPLAATVVTAIIILLIYVARKRINMIIQIFKEASKSIGAMPQLFIQPLISFLAFILSGALFGYFSSIVAGATSKQISRSSNGPDDIVVCTFIFLYWGAIWLTYFYKGCQSMVIGGSVATWYFSRDKSRLNSPMWRSTSNMVRYHMGTIAFGSFLMLLMEIVKTISNFFTKSKVGRCCGCCCICICCLLKNFIKYFEGIIKYFTKMSYIMTSIHSVPFCTGCREAIVLLVQHAFSLLQLKCFCKFVLGLLQLIIVVIVVALCKYVVMADDELADIVSIISGVFAFFAANSFMSVYNIAIDTIFLCYCEDLAENDGVSKPYFMSTELMRFMEISKRTLGDIVRDITGLNDVPISRNGENPSAPALGPI